MPPDHVALSEQTLNWVARQVHPRGRVRSSERLVGGITAAMDRLVVTTPDAPRDVVLRRWLDPDGAAARVARESEALTAVVDLPAPRLLAADPTGLEAGAPCTLTTALPGVPDLAPRDPASWLAQLAAAQAAVHAVRARPAARWHRWAERERPLAWIRDPGLRAAARAAAAGPLTPDDVLAHGDYQPFNVLWSAGRLTGVVDWPNAATAHRGSDVGHCRLNLAVLLDAPTAAAYVTAYERAAGARLDRRADLQALLCWDVEWLDFIPVQVAGRVPVDVAGMADRVVAAVRDSVDALG